MPSSGSYILSYKVQLLGDIFGQLVGAAGAATTAVIALEQISNCFGILPFYKLSYSSQISGAAAVKAYIVQLSVNYIKMNLAGADSPGIISKHISFLHCITTYIKQFDKKK